jgi:hypothetical protein
VGEAHPAAEKKETLLVIVLVLSDRRERSSSSLRIPFSDQIEYEKERIRKKPELPARSWVKNGVNKPF